jgi:hypothetical protein
MRIDNDMPQKIQQVAPQPPREVPGERELDGDADDARRVDSRARPAEQIRSETIGNRVDILA